MAANTPPLPHEEGDRFTNDDTGITYQFSNGAWRAVSSEASEEVADAISKLDLQTVLDNGNVADKPLAIETANGVSVLEDQALRITHQQNPYIRLVDEADGDALEITLNDDHGHIDMSDESDELHFKFANIEKVTFKGTGDAEFQGRVKVQPGVEENEAVTYGQLSTVAEGLEQLAPSFERGMYSISTQEVTSSSTHNGKYNLIRKNTSSDGNAARAACADAQNVCNRIPDNDPIDCQIEYNRCIDAIPGPGTVDIYISDFSQVEQLKFSKVDVNGEDHTWDGVLIGQLIDVFNEDNDNYMVGRITAIEGTTVKTFSVDVLSSKGSASGNARIKVFSLSETGDVTNYVRKTGDTMTGTLETTSQILILPDGYGARGKTNMLVVNQRNAADGSIVRVQKQSQDVFKVEHSGDTSLMNNKLVRVATPTSATDGANKQYVDEVASATPTPFTWTLEDAATNTSKGCMRFKDNKFIYLSSLTYEGIQLSNPTDLPSGAHNFSSYMPAVGSGTSLAKTMKIWQQSSSGAWQLKAWMIPYRYRFWYGGWVQLEYKGREGDMTPSYGSRYGLSLPDLF